MKDIGIEKYKRSPTFSIEVGSKGQELLEYMLKEINKSFENLDDTGVEVRISIPNIGKPVRWRVRVDIDYDEMWQKAQIEVLEDLLEDDIWLHPLQKVKEKLSNLKKKKK